MTLNYSKNLPNCLPLNQAHLSTFPFTQLSTPSACLTEQNVLVAKLNACCEIESFQSLLASLEKNILTPSHLRPPRGSACPGCSPPLLLPLSSGSKRAGVPPFSFPSSCLSRKVSGNQTNAGGPSPTSRKIGRYWADLPGNLRPPG